MKKLLFLLLVIPFLISASPLQQKHLAVIAALNSGSCAGEVGSSFTTDNDAMAGGFIQGIPVTATCTGDIVALDWYIPATDRASSVAMAIYSDNEGAVGTLLGTTAEFADPNSVGWHRQPLVSAVEVTQGVDYWVMWWPDTDATGQRVSIDAVSGTNVHCWVNAGAVNTEAWPASGAYGYGTDDVGIRMSYDE